MLHIVYTDIPQRDTYLYSHLILIFRHIEDTAQGSWIKGIWQNTL